MSAIQPYQPKNALTVLDGFGRAMLGALDRIFETDARSPYALRISRWTFFEDQQRGSLYAGLELDPQRLYHLPLARLENSDTLAKLSLAVHGRKVFAVRDRGFWYLVQLQAPRQEAPVPAPSVKLPNLVKIDLQHAPERPLSVPFGVLASGPQYLDLTQPNHILIAGTTQTGKSSFVQAALITLCSFNTPDQVKIAIVDPKGEFVHWHGTSHLYAPIAGEAQPAMKLINDVVSEMDRRRKLFEAATARNLAQYQIRTGNHLPLLVVVIDEFVDLALEIGRAYIPVLMRLVNKAASYGIRLILATQSPKADIVDSALRQQCGIRIAFRCTDVWQSESVLGQGKRDAARLPNIPGRFVAQLPGASELVEGQAYYVDDETLDAVTDRLRAKVATEQAAAAPALEQRDCDIALFCLSQKDKAGLFVSTRIAKEFGIHPRDVAVLAAEWDKRQWLLPEIGCRGRLSKSIRDLVGWADQA